MRENVSAIHLSAFSALCMSKWRNYLHLDLKLLWGAQSKINKKVYRTLSEGTWHLFNFLQSLNLQRKGGEIRSKANLSGEFDRRSYGWSPLCHRMGQFKQKQDRSAFRPFCVWYFRYFCNLNYAVFSGREINVISMKFLTEMLQMVDTRRNLLRAMLQK